MARLCWAMCGEREGMGERRVRRPKVQEEEGNQNIWIIWARVSGGKAAHPWAGDFRVEGGVFYNPYPVTGRD